MNLVSLLLKTAHENSYALVMIDHFTKFSRSIPLLTSTPSVVTNASLDHWVYENSALRHALPDNGLQFVVKLFDAISTFLGVT